MPARTTAAPSAKSFLAQAAPIPLEAPVTTAVFPSRRPMVFYSSNHGIQNDTWRAVELLECLKPLYGIRGSCQLSFDSYLSSLLQTEAPASAIGGANLRVADVW